jgi:hypothetical protein
MMPWFDAQAAGLLGGLYGALVGLSGGLVGILVATKKARVLALGVFILVIDWSHPYIFWDNRIEAWTAN